MSLSTFLSNIKNKRIQSQLEFVNNYKRVHGCKLSIMFHNNGLLIMDANKRICILDLIVTM